MQWTRSVSRFLAGLAAMLLAATPVRAQEFSVVVTIKPVHSLVAAIMDGTGSPRLLIDGTGSPHTFTLKPTDAKSINAADVFIRVSETLEPFTARIVKSLPKKVAVVSLAAAPGLTLHDMREGGTFETHAHEPKKGKAGAHGHAHGHDRAGAAADETDGHIWLDPANAKVIAAHVAEILAARQPAHAERYKANAAALSVRLDALDAELKVQLASFAGRPYLVFHDAYQYLERRYGLTPVGAVTVSSDVPPSAKRLTELRRKITNLKAVCVFAEPQFAPKVIDTIVEGLPARRGVLDPLGAAIPAAPGQYFVMMRAMSSAIRECLANPV